MEASKQRQEEKLLKTAVEWFVRLQSEHCSAEEYADFRRWLERSDAHRSAYANTERIWGSLDEIKQLRVPGLNEARAARPPSRSGRVTTFLLVLGFLASGGLYFEEQQAQPVLYSTGLGETRTVTLADGSRIAMNAMTRLTVTQSLLRRDVMLASGEALFEVVHQAWRPFTVKAGALSIRDIGTLFDVRLRLDAVSVDVLKGEVSLDDGRTVRKQTVAAGSSRAYRKDAGLGPRQPADAERDRAWLEGRLVFRQTPLSEVVAEMERHHPVKFDFADGEISRQTLSGNFDAGDLQPFLKALETILPLKAIKSGDRIIVQQAEARSR
ncbi:FecR family protein [Methyloterricola oryzae]|uniref:FecR family protein n=1 Tax=Methyloterricola oryzae TaxID=1495050 RepID=UPI0005EBD8E0|nr:FecR domain-containing protein [Methyloterricola oryzae]